MVNWVINCHSYQTWLDTAWYKKQRLDIPLTTGPSVSLGSEHGWGHGWRCGDSTLQSHPCGPVWILDPMPSFFKVCFRLRDCQVHEIEKAWTRPFSQIKCTYYLRPFIYIHLYYLEPGAGYVFFPQIYSGLCAFIQIYVVVNFLSQVIFIFLLFQLH